MSNPESTASYLGSSQIEEATRIDDPKAPRDRACFLMTLTRIPRPVQSKPGTQLGEPRQRAYSTAFRPLIANFPAT